METSEIRHFLLEHLKTNQIGHTGRNLYTHLHGTQQILETWGNRQALCMAGLFHSIYGTWHFRKSAFPITRRDVIQKIIGEEAERLVYIFCVTQRPKVFIDNISVQHVMVMDHYSQTPLVIEKLEFADLLELEAANLLEQGGNSIEALKQLLRGSVSSLAKTSIKKHLAEAGLANRSVITTELALAQHLDR